MSLTIFDCDGVLIDSEVISCRCASEFLTAAGVPISPETIMERFVGMPRANMMKQLEAEHGLSLPGDLEPRLSAAIVERFDTELRAIDGVGEAIAAIAAGGGRFCVASGSRLDYIRRALSLTGLRDLFDDAHLFSSTMVRRGKPAPDVFLHAAATMGAKAEDCVVVEDSLVGIQAALAAGMTVLGFSGGAHHAHGSAEARLRAAGAHRVFDDMRELPSILATV